jgi:Xaa-Pro aminopeptidase
MGAVGTQTVNTTERLAALRNLMAERNIDAYVVPSEDQRKLLELSDRGFTAI